MKHMKVIVGNGETAPGTPQKTKNNPYVFFISTFICIFSTFTGISMLDVC